MAGQNLWFEASQKTYRSGIRVKEARFMEKRHEEERVRPPGFGPKLMWKSKGCPESLPVKGVPKVLATLGGP